MHFLIAICASIFILSCSSTSAEPTDVSVDVVTNADVGSDTAGLEDVGRADVLSDDSGFDVATPDVGSDGSMDVAIDSGDVEVTNVTLTGPATVDFEASYWGNDEAPGTFYIETIADGTGMCPLLADPAPEANLIVTVDNTGDAPSVTAATIVDFGGTILPDDVFRSLDVTITNFVVDAAAEQIRFSLTGSDEQGTIAVSGTVVANYCLSLDT